MKNTRRCRYCKDQFLPRFNSLKESCCQKSECFKSWMLDESLKVARRKKTKYNIESKTIQAWVLDAQKIFNTYIRERDYGKVCISCQLTPKKKNAGHYHNANNHWAVRFNEDNVNLQCEACNTSLSGNLINYRKNLILKIGEHRLDELDQIANETANFSIDEIKDLMEYYKEKTNLLKEIRDARK